MHFIHISDPNPSETGGPGTSQRFPTVGLLVCSIALVGCDNQPEEKPHNLLTQPAPTVLTGSPTAHPLNQRVEARDYALRVVNVKECVVAEHFKPGEGNKRLGIDVDFEGLSTREVPVNPFYATLVTPDGERYEPTLAGCQPPLRAQRITQGKSARGWISFDVPARVARLNLEYRPVVIGVGHEELLFKVLP